MTKKKRPSGGGGVWYAHAHELSDEARVKLAVIAGIDISEPESAECLQKHFWAVEYALGMYPGAVENIDNAQTPGEYVKDAKRLRKLANDLLMRLRESTDWTRLELQMDGFEVSELELAVGRFMDSVRQMERKHEGQKQAGNARKDALRLVIQNLRNVFHRIYAGDKSPRVKRGAIQKASPLEKAEESFVLVALKDAGIRAPSPISRYFDDVTN